MFASWNLITVCLFLCVSVCAEERAPPAFSEAEDLGHQTFMAVGRSVGGLHVRQQQVRRTGGEQHEKWMNFQRKGTIYSEQQEVDSGEGARDHLLSVSVVYPCMNQLGVSDLLES